VDADVDAVTDGAVDALAAAEVVTGAGAALGDLEADANAVLVALMVDDADADAVLVEQELGRGIDLEIDLVTGGLPVAVAGRDALLSKLEPTLVLVVVDDFDPLTGRLTPAERSEDVVLDREMLRVVLLAA